jgi:hypothetical protein
MQKIIDFMKSFLVVVSILKCCLWPTQVDAQHLERNISTYVEQGVIQGRIWRFDKHKVQMFLGIPYARPPLGELRLAVSGSMCENQVIWVFELMQKPEKAVQWGSRTRDAFNYGPACMQFMDYHQNDRFSAEQMKRQSEDCLYLNVFAPYVRVEHFSSFWIVRSSVI